MGSRKDTITKDSRSFQYIKGIKTNCKGVTRTISFEPKLGIMKFVFILFLASIFAVGILGNPIHDDYGNTWWIKDQRTNTKYCEDKEDEDKTTDPKCCWKGAHVIGKWRYYQDPGKDVDCVKVEKGRKKIQPEKAEMLSRCGYKCHCRSCKMLN